MCVLSLTMLCTTHTVVIHNCRRFFKMIRLFAQLVYHLMLLKRRTIKFKKMSSLPYLILFNLSPFD